MSDLEGLRQEWFTRTGNHRPGLTTELIHALEAELAAEKQRGDEAEAVFKELYEGSMACQQKQRADELERALRLAYDDGYLKGIPAGLQSSWETWNASPLRRAREEKT